MTGTVIAQQPRCLYNLGWPGSNRRIQESKSCALPLGDSPRFKKAITWHTM